MKEQHDNNLDKLFAEKLGNFKAEPPDTVWRTVAAGVISGAAGTAVWSTVLKPVIWSLSLVSMVFVLNTSTPEAEEQVFSEQSSIVREHITPLPTRDISEIPQISETSILPIETSDFRYSEPIAETPNNTEPVNAVIAETNSNNNTATLNPQISKAENILLEKPLQISQVWKPNIPNPLSMQAVGNSKLDYDLSQPSDYVRTPWLYLSLNSGPDAFAFNSNRVDFESWGSNVGLGISMHMSEFYFRTGLNFLNITQKNSYAYSTNEFQQIGEITSVDSINFITQYDSLNNPYLVPVYYTSNHPQFDSVAVNYNTHSLDNYRFFEIPMIIGIQKDIKRFTVYAQTGFTYTFSLNSNELSREHFEESSGTTIQSWSPLSEQRLDNFWSFSLAMGAYYNTNRNISFGIEPTYRYYIDPFFSGPGTDQRTPVSYGVRFRLLYKL